MKRTKMTWEPMSHPAMGESTHASKENQQLPYPSTEPGGDRDHVHSEPCHMMHACTCIIQPKSTAKSYHVIHLMENSARAVLIGALNLDLLTIPSCDQCTGNVSAGVALRHGHLVTPGVKLCTYVFRWRSYTLAS